MNFWSGSVNSLLEIVLETNKINSVTIIGEIEKIATFTKSLLNFRYSNSTDKTSVKATKSWMWIGVGNVAVLS